MSHTNLSLLSDYMSSLYAAGTHNPWASITQYCSRKRGRGREQWTGRWREWQSCERDNMTMGKQKRKITKWWRKGSKTDIVGRKGSKIGESACTTPFKLPAESVQLHLITWEGQQRCSFPMAIFYAPVYTDQQRLIILFFSFSQTHWHTHACFSTSLPLPFSP